MSEGIATEDFFFFIILFFFLSLNKLRFVHRLHLKKINSVQSVSFFFDSHPLERGYTSVSSLTRLAVSLKLSSVGEKVLGRSFFEFLAAGTNGDGSGAEESALLAGFSSFICKIIHSLLLFYSVVLLLLLFF